VTTPAGLLAELFALGVTVEPGPDGTVRVRPAAAVPAWLKAAVRNDRPGVRAALDRWLPVCPHCAHDRWIVSDLDGHPICAECKRGWVPAR
jgi:hypothetical protein